MSTTTTTDTEKLQHFMEDYVSHVLSNFYKPSFSIDTLKLLSQILQQMEKSDKAFHQLKKVHLREQSKRKKSPLTEEEKIIQNEIDKKNGGTTASIKEQDADINDIIENVSNYQFVPEYAREHIQQHIDPIGKSFQFRIDNRNINLYMFFPRRPSGNGHNKRIIMESLRKIYNLLHFLTAFSPTKKECSQNLSIYLFLTDLKKTLIENCHANDTKNCILGEQNANTAFTFACKPNNEVFLYREEEWLKVLTHELFHSFGFDYSGIVDENMNHKINEIFPLNLDMRIYEAYSEFWAEVLNVFFYCYYHHKTGSDVIKMTLRMLLKERMFSLFQASKVLLHNGMSYKDTFERTERSRRLRELNYKETTPIFSYYVIKNILMFSMNDFFIWCLENNQPFPMVLKNSNGFIEFIREHFNNPKLLECMDEMQEWFLKKQGKIQRQDKMPLLTMRITLTC